MKKKLLLLPVFLFILAGCADESEDNWGGNNATPEQLKAVDEAFYMEYKKQVKEAPADKFSSQTEGNIKSLIRNLTGRGMMPAHVGIGEVKEKHLASAMGKKVVESFAKSNEDKVQSLVLYKSLDIPETTFLGSITGILMGSETGKTVLNDLKRYRQNQTAVAKLVDAHVKLFGNQKVTANGYVNLAYFYASLTDYFTMLKIDKLPTDDTKVKAVTQVVFGHCKDKPEQNNIDKWNIDTPKFTVMPILTCGTRNPLGAEMTSFMNNLGKVFDPNFSYIPPVNPMDIVDNNFYTEFKKQVTNAPADSSFSKDAENNIKLIMQSITGRADLKPELGIGSITGEHTASAIGRKVVEKLKSNSKAEIKALADYNTLNSPTAEYKVKLMAEFQNPSFIEEIVGELKGYQKNQIPTEKLIKEHAALFANNGKVVPDTYVNLAYLYTNFLPYTSNFGFKNFPEGDDKLKQFAKIFYNQCGGKSPNDLAAFSGDTTKFGVMPVLTCGTYNPFGEEMTKLMNSLGKLYEPNIVYPPVQP